MRIGVLGGTFNPPHRAHVAVAVAAADALALDRVLLVPAATPPHKAVDDDPGAAERLALCRAAVADAADPRLEASDVELRRDGPSYTADTLAVLAAEHPGAELWLVLGADQAAALPTWDRPETVLARARIAVAQRPGTAASAVREALERLGAGDRLDPFAVEPSEASSSAVRRRLRAGEDVGDLLGPAVRHRVAERGLYPAAATSTVGGVASPPEAPDVPVEEQEVRSPGTGPEADAALAELVGRVAELAADRKAGDLEAIDLREVSPYADAFLLCTGNTERQVKAIHDAVLEGLKADRDLRPRSVEGLTGGRWVLMDYGDVVVHVQVPEARDFYRLSRLWGDRPRIPLPEADAG